MRIRTGVPAFDNQWDGTVPTSSVNSTKLFTVIRIYREAKYYAGDGEIAKFIQNLFETTDNEHLWVYEIGHETPRSKQYVIHGVIIADDQRFPIKTFPANRRKDSAKVLTAIKMVIDSLAWDELEARLVAQFEKDWDWDGLKSDVEINPQFDKYDGNGITGITFMCSFPVLRDLAHSQIYRLLERADVEDFEIAVYVDDTLEGAMETAADAHGLWSTVEENCFYVGKTLLEVGDTVRLAVSREVTYEDYPNGYGHASVQPAEQLDYTFEVGHSGEVTKIEDLDDILVELYADGIGSYYQPFTFSELEIVSNHKG